MAAGDTALSICSDALLMLGAKPISSFDEGTDEASVANRLYPDIKDQAILMYPWSFSYKKTSIARLITTPINEYRYEYQLPGDRLTSPRAIYDTSATNIPPRKEYRIIGDKLLADYEQVYIDYQYSVPEFEMPSYFVQLLKYMMTWHLALPITDQTDKSQYWQSVATGSPAENGRGGYLRQAMNIDGAGNPTNAINDFSLISVRY
jgi:hypothetical protein